jgi:tetratricopeptide (TPR) repeat protein
MRRNIIITILFFLAISASEAQVPSTAAHKAVFAQSLKAGDIGTAVLAANYIVAADANSSYRDSLAILYYNVHNANSAYYWATTVLKGKPADADMLEVKAQCLKNANDPLAAIDAYTELMKLKPLPVYAYELMDLQHSVQRLMECAALAQKTLQEHIDSTIKVAYTVDGKTQKQTKLKAAIYNVYGLALADLKNLPEAKKAFEMALLVDRDYALAQKNLEMVNMLQQVLDKGNKADDKDKPKG